MSSAILFFGLNLITGLLGYLFQILASQKLSASGFAEFNTWLAHLSVFFVLTSLLQYVSAFFSVDKKKFRFQILFVNLFCAALLLVVFSFQPLTLAQWGTLIICTMLPYAWLIGQVQNRMMYFTLGFVGCLTTGFKVAGVSYMKAPQVDQYILLMFLSLFPALIFVSVAGWITKNNPAPKKVSGTLLSMLSAPIIISIASSVIPQLDILILSRTQGAAVYEPFVHASLFARGIFFLFMIFAQWLLPRQMRTVTSFKNKFYNQNWLFLFAILGAGLIAVASPYVDVLILHWTVSPSVAIVFLSCWEMALLTWIYLIIQEDCVSIKPILSIIVMGCISVLSLVQVFIGLEIKSYFILSIIVLHFIILILSLKTSPKITRFFKFIQRYSV